MTGQLEMNSSEIPWIKKCALKDGQLAQLLYFPIHAYIGYHQSGWQAATPTAWRHPVSWWKALWIWQMFEERKKKKIKTHPSHRTEPHQAGCWLHIQPSPTSVQKKHPVQKKKKKKKKAETWHFLSSSFFTSVSWVNTTIRSSSSNMAAEGKVSHYITVTYPAALNIHWAVTGSNAVTKLSFDFCITLVFRGGRWASGCSANLTKDVHHVRPVHHVCLD